jgi:N-acetylglucosamine-6-phosphate deacetylase
MFDPQSVRRIEPGVIPIGITNSADGLGRDFGTTDMTATAPLSSTSNPRSLLGRRYDTGEPVRILLEGSKIAAIDAAWPQGQVDNWPFVAPGLFDLQINGYGGVWFSDRTLTAERATRAIEAYLAHGVTRLCPTLITSSFETLAAGFRAIREACHAHEWVDAMVAGCHLEGPYLSGEDGPRGAHPRAHIRPADWDEFRELQKISGERIRLVTIAPEVPHALEFIRQAVVNGVTIAIGHTAANADQIGAAVDAGALLSTHLGNGAHPMLKRHPNYIWDQLGEPRLSASLIVDGWHLPDSVVRGMVQAKSVARSILTCDASGWAGCSPGRYENELGQVEVLEGGRIVVAGQDQLLAGSASTTEECVAQVIRCGAANLREAVQMASGNPARLLGFPEPRLIAGDRADLILFHHRPAESRIEVTATLLGGGLRFGAIQAG